MVEPIPASTFQRPATPPANGVHAQLGGGVPRGYSAGLARRCAPLPGRDGRVARGMSAQPTVPARVAIIIPTFDGLGLLRPCLAALDAQTFRDFTVTVVDDGSTDGTASWLATAYPTIYLIRHERNRGLVAACNAGISATTSDLVCLLNNDTEAEPGWLGALVAALDAAPDAGSASSKMLLFRPARTRSTRRATASRSPGCRSIAASGRSIGGSMTTAAPPFGPCAGAALYPPPRAAGGRR